MRFLIFTSKHDISPFWTTSLLQIMGCESTESFRWVSRLGSWFSVAKFGHFQLTASLKSLFPKSLRFHEKTRVIRITTRLSELLRTPFSSGAFAPLSQKYGKTLAPSPFELTLQAKPSRSWRAGRAGEK